MTYNAIMYFGIVAFSEEGAKYFLLRRRSWHSAAFNCQFDGVVYAVFVALGFALWENISYVLMYGLSTALVRAVTAVPGHACFGVFMGVWYGLAKRLTAQGKRVTAVLGFNRESEIFLAEEFRALGVEVIIATADGSTGIHGLVTDGMAAVSDYTYLYTCGPEPMLKAVYSACKTSGQFSFEERMGCGFGACMGCSCKTKYGSKRICKDGPVLEKEEIVW